MTLVTAWIFGHLYLNGLEEPAVAQNWFNGQTVQHCVDCGLLAVFSVQFIQLSQAQPLGHAPFFWLSVQLNLFITVGFDLKEKQSCLN